jgi:hypothetical protein
LWRQAVVLALAVVLYAGVFVGRHVATPHDVPVAYAACVIPPSLCGGSDTTKTSSVSVSHVYDTGSSLIPVEPQHGETYEVVGRWDADINDPNPQCSCLNYQTAQATVVVERSGSGWSASCTQGCSGNGPIFGVDICTIDSCTRSGATISWSYELIVNLAQTRPPIGGCTSPFPLTKVTYTTTSVDDGYEVDTSNCTLGTSRTPTSQTFSVDDEGGFECPFTCADATGPSLAIVYE